MQLAARLAWVLLGWVGMTGAAPAWAAKVQSIHPQGEVAQVRQVRVRFNEAVVALGDPRLPAPFSLSCTGPVPAGQGRWTGPNEWVYDFQAALPPGVRCTVKPVDGWAPLHGSLEPTPPHSFSTGGPSVQRADPWDGATIESDQHFLLHLNGPVVPASVATQAWCEVDGIGERIAVRVVEGGDRQAVLTARHVSAAQAASTVLLGCSRPLPAGAKVRVVWGEGIASAADPAVKTRITQRFTYRVQEPFTAEFSCEREKAHAPCMPLSPLVLKFSSPVPRATLQAVRLVDAQGKETAPTFDKEGDESDRLSFATPLPEEAKLRIQLPKDVKDVQGRPLANASAFPLAVATGPAPPLAKFAAAPFGIVEWGPEAMLPVTLRHVQAELATGAKPAAPQGAVRSRRIDIKDWLGWMGKLAALQREERKTRATPLLAKDASARRMDLPQLNGNQPRPFEVVGIPLSEPGYHVVEIESKLLGTRLLAKPAPMYVRTGVLVTNLGVHFKHGRENSLAWVTTLDRAQPVPGAEVVVHNCAGAVLWHGMTDAQGLAHIPQALPSSQVGRDCPWQDGYFVTASKAMADSTQANGRMVRDESFVFSSWYKGMEPWRFAVPTDADSRSSPIRAHTVFDRTLLRAGETVSMKHLLRAEVGSGLRDVPANALPKRLVIEHVGSGDKVEQPLTFDAAGRAALSVWHIPPNAKLGVYEVSLQGAANGQGFSSGSFRVEEFRVPLVQARLTTPKAIAATIAPTQLDVALQLNHLSGGGVARAPLRTSAVMRDRAVSFPRYEGFSFEPPREAQRQESGDDEGNDADAATRLVVDKQSSSTDAQGAATLQLSGWPKVTRPTDLQVEVGFSDPNGELQTATTTVPLWPASRVVGLRSAAYSAQRGSAQFQALALGLDGQPLAGAKISVQARLTQWQASRKRLVGGFYAYDQRSSKQELGTVCEGKTDARGLLLCEASFKAAGEVELIARSADEAGRTSEAATTVWVTRQGELWFEQDNDDRIDVLADKTQVAPGDRVKLQVRMPYRQATALVSVEREGIFSTQVVTLQGDDPTVEITIPKRGNAKDNAAERASWAPNVYASVLVLRGRVRHVPWYSFFSWGWKGPVEWWQAFRYEGRDHQAPTAMVDLAKPSHKFGMVQLQVGVQEHALEVKVAADRAQYAPRQTVKTQVTVLHNGLPAAGAEFAFAAVDEGLLQLMPNGSWPLLERMFQPRAWGVETGTAYSEIIGRRHYGRKAVAAGGGGGRNPTRELFDTLLLWRGTVKLDAKGQAQIDVPLNDSLSSFRLVAVASDGVDRFGTGSTSVRVTQDLQMLPGLPPVARDGDQFDAGYTLRNTTDRAMQVTASLQATAARDDGAGGITRTPMTWPAVKLSLPAGGAAPVQWPVNVPAGATSIAFEASVQQGDAPQGGGGAAVDRVKTTQIVRPAVPLRVWQATLQQLEGTLTLPVAPPADALPASGPKRGGLAIGVQPSLTGALPGIRRFFENYPFNCLEQQTSRALALRDTKAWATLGDALNGYLDADGLALYYPARAGDEARGSDRLTAYVLAASHEAGMPLPDAQRERMLQALGAVVEGRLMRRPWSPAAARGLDLDVRKLAAIEALSRYGRAAPKQLQSINLTPNLWPTAALIDWLRILQRLDGVPERDQRLKEAMTLLRSRLTYAGTTLKFSNEEGDYWWWLMDSADANAARLILAVVDDATWKDELPRMVVGALGRQQRAAWATTTANLWGVLALNRFAAKFENQAITGHTTATLGAAKVSHDWAAAKQGGRLSLPWADQPGALTVQQQGSGKPWLSVQALSAVPLKDALYAGYRISRSITAVERKSPNQWTRGDVLRVRVEIDAQADASWVALNDPVPTGATLLGTGLGGDSALATAGERKEGSAWLAYEERAQDAYRASWEFMPRGKHVIEYTLRLNNSGHFQLPPSRVESMYAPDSFGESPNAAVEVKP